MPLKLCSGTAGVPPANAPQARSLSGSSYHSFRASRSFAGEGARGLRKSLSYFLERACQAASTSASRSTVIPALNFARRSGPCCRIHSSVACVVSENDRKVSPISSAF